MTDLTEQSKTLACNIREFRKCLGMSQRDFAAVFGVTQANISQWENGVVSPPLSILQIIRKKYKEVSAEYFFTKCFPGKKYFEDPDQVELYVLKKEAEGHNATIKSLKREIEEKRQEIARLRDQIDVLNKVLKKSL